MLLRPSYSHCKDSIYTRTAYRYVLSVNPLLVIILCDINIESFTADEKQLYARALLEFLHTSSHHQGLKLKWKSDIAIETKKHHVEPISARGMLPKIICHLSIS